ncbi:MAG: DNA-processing protein DprA [Chloroflexi bacterium]|nr:DNA-processing protein DprA [Chloroflexota bacterium]MDA8189010.1 DNA-processing protein DprA [Dehalococcoidales bacterium]
MGDPRYWIGLTLVPGIGPARLRRLLDYFGQIETAWHADLAELIKAGLDSKSADAVVAARRQIDLDDRLEKIGRQSIDVITWEDPRYPERLKNIYAPPPVLYMKGSLLPCDDWSIAVVGTRRATIYGKQIAEQMVAGLVASSITIVSGLARGIDTFAHQACLQAGGRTIAVLGSGVDVIYPPENARLARQIVENGAVLSEHPLGTKPDAVNFPQRNRIVSGMTLGTLVVEGDTNSGAMLTAGYALDQGREVFAVPGNIFHRSSQGTNRLIQRSGAKLVVTAQDILEELNLQSAPQQMEIRELIPENDTESALLKALSAEPLHIDEIIRSSGLPVAEVSSALAMMELKGMVKHLGGMNYVLARACS